LPIKNKSYQADKIVLKPDRKHWYKFMLVETCTCKSIKAIFLHIKKM